jgi:hypothetical protein
MAHVLAVGVAWPSAPGQAGLAGLAGQGGVGERIAGGLAAGVIITA